jgi:hypothetical protein
MWTLEDTKVTELHRVGMEWEAISKCLPGQSAISCRLQYASAPQLATPSNKALDQAAYILNPKQVNRIKKRRLTRSNLFLIHRPQIVHQSLSNHAKRRQRGARGRFLTAAEKEVMDRRTPPIDPTLHASHI